VRVHTNIAINTAPCFGAFTPTLSCRYVLRRGGHLSEALALAQGLLLRCAPPVITSVSLAANCYITSCFYEHAYQLLTTMRPACSEGFGSYDAAMLCNYGISAAACGSGTSVAVAALHEAVTLSRSSHCISRTRLHQDICCCACVVVAGVMKRESCAPLPLTYTPFCRIELTRSTGTSLFPLLTPPAAPCTAASNGTRCLRSWSAVSLMLTAAAAPVVRAWAAASACTIIG
jgi:hypothetical protein